MGRVKSPELGALIEVDLAVSRPDKSCVNIIGDTGKSCKKKEEIKLNPFTALVYSSYKYLRNFTEKEAVARKKQDLPTDVDFIGY